MRQIDMITHFCGGDYNAIVNKKCASLSCRITNDDNVGLYCYDDLIAAFKIDTNEIVIINRIDKTNVMYQLLCKIKRELLELSINYTCKNDFNLVDYY